MILMVKKLLERFMKKKCKTKTKKIERDLELKKYLVKKEKSYILNGKAMIIHLITGLIKKALYKMSQYFSKSYEPFGGAINVKVDLSSYATKIDLEKQQEFIPLI